MNAKASAWSQELKQKRRRGPYLPRELRIRIYEDVLELRKQGLSYNKIINEMKRRYGITLGLSIVSYWCRGLRSPYRDGTKLTHLTFSEDLAYVIGAVLGDGTVFKMSNPPPKYGAAYIIKLAVKDKEFADEFARRLATIIGRIPKLRLVRGKWTVEAACKALYELLLKKPKINIEKIQPYVQHCKVCIGAFLRGFFDSEATVHIRHGHVRVFNSDYELLDYVIYLLGLLGIKTTSKKPRIYHRAGSLHIDKSGKIIRRRKDLYYVAIRAKSNLTFYEKVGFTIERKRKRLEDYLKRRGLLPNDSMTT